MDTSTLSFTEISAPIALTSVAVPLQAVAAPDWFTRLLSPLTNQHSISQVALAMATQAVSSEQIPQQPYPPSQNVPRQTERETEGPSTLILIFIPVMVVILTVLLGLVIFLVAVLYVRRKKGIRLTEDGGPLDLSKGDGVIGEGGVDGVEMRWLETVEPDVREAYKRAKDYQLQYPPSSVPTDITLSQFLSIQEKGVSAWSFEPDYEDNLSLYVQSRTEITFLADGPGMTVREGGGNNVMANLPLPKLNEVYYWEVKMYDKPANTEVAIGLATKPYPSFRLPGWNKYSIAYFATDGFKSHNYPFTAASYGPPLAEGDVLGVGYRPRTGTVFFTRNGRKLEDAYTGLQRLNLFPTIGANGACTVHVNLGQAGFVFIEANVKKWGLAPMVGTLAPPPAYGSERGSILLDAGYGTPGSHHHTNLNGVGALLESARNRSAQLATSAGSSTYHGRPIPPAVGSPLSQRSSNGSSSRRHRRAGKTANLAGSIPAVPSPLRVADNSGPGPRTIGSRRRALALGRAQEEEPTYISPTDTPPAGPRGPSPDALENVVSEEEDEDERDSGYSSLSNSEREGSPIEHNPPTPNLLDISLHSLRGSGMHYFGGRAGRAVERDSSERERPEEGSGSGSGSGESAESSDTLRPGHGIIGPPDGSPPPPGYAPLDPHVYSGGLPADLPEDMVNQAIAAMSGDPVEGNGQNTPTPARRVSGPLGWLPFGPGRS